MIRSAGQRVSRRQGEVERAVHGKVTTVYVILALSSAILLGLWKFGIGQFRGRISTYSVVLVSASSAAVVYLLLGFTTSGLAFDRWDAYRGLIGGAFNVAGTILVLKAFERGKLGVVTGVASASTLVPLTYSVLAGEPVSRLAACGIVVILAGLLTFYVPNMKAGAGASNSKAAIVMAAAAALSGGVAIVVIDIGSRVSVTGTMFISQRPHIAFTLIMVVVVTDSLRGLTGLPLAAIAGAGLALALGNVAFFTAANEGNIGVVSVIGSLSPIVVALLALAILGEQMVRSERLALLIVLAGTCLVVS